MYVVIQNPKPKKGVLQKSHRDATRGSDENRHYFMYVCSGASNQERKGGENKNKNRLRCHVHTCRCSESVHLFS